MFGEIAPKLAGKSMPVTCKVLISHLSGADWTLISMFLPLSWIMGRTAAILAATEEKTLESGGWNLPVRGSRGSSES